MALSPSRAIPLDPSHTYRFETACSAVAANSLVSITTVGKINIPCNTWTEIGAANLSPFDSFEYAIALAAPADSAKICTQSGLTKTGTFKCRSQKYWMSFKVIDEGVIPPF
jgi:hypothetical protein